MSHVLLTGATGYIGSHTWLALLEAGHEVVGLDNFANSSPKVLGRLAELAGRPVQFEEADVCDPAALAGVLSRHRIDAVVHFAAHKAVGESVQQPLRYYRNNIGGLLGVAQAMQEHGVFRLVFSSSATVYGQPEALPIPEDAALATTNPYGMTKLVGEQLLAELQQCDPRWQIARLRYFNPVGAHQSGRIGEDPRGVPNNLMPYVCQVAVGTRAELQVYGGDYPTPDGTGVRDYIHVMDLAEGHVASMKHLLEGGGSHVANLGTGRGHSVLEVVRAFEQASGRQVPYRIVERRAGDVAACYADPGLARQLLGWTARRDLAAMCADAWRWQHAHPRGFDT
jgi:UDP-glucose 4-epimerase